MVVITCDRCETRFDTEREPATRHASTTRCPSCGEDHAAPDAIEPAPPTRPDGVEFGQIARAIDEADGEVHVHFHKHSE